MAGVGSGALVFRVRRVLGVVLYWTVSQVQLLYRCTSERLGAGIQGAAIVHVPTIVHL